MVLSCVCMCVCIAGWNSEMAPPHAAFIAYNLILCCMISCIKRFGYSVGLCCVGVAVGWVIM